MSSSRNGRKLPKLQGGISAPHSYSEGTKIVKKKKKGLRSAPPKRNLEEDTLKPFSNEPLPVTIGHLSPVNLSRKSSISSLDRINSLYTDNDLHRISISELSDEIAAVPPPMLNHQRNQEASRAGKFAANILSPVSVTRKSCLDKINTRFASTPANSHNSIPEPVESLPKMISQASQVSPKVSFSPGPPTIVVDPPVPSEGTTEAPVEQDESGAGVIPPTPPSSEGQRDHLMTQSSARPSPSYQVPRKGVMASLARFGFISAMHTAKQIKLVNDTTVPLLYVVSSDLLARKIESLNFAAGSSGVSGGVSMNSRGVIHQVIPLQARSSVEVQCRTDYNYLTIANRLPDGRFAVQRFQRQVQVGYVYTFSGNKMTHLDIRSSTFIEDLTTK